MSTPTFLPCHTPSEILCLSQSASPNTKEAQNQVVNLFGDKLKGLTARTCRRCYLHHQEQEDVLSETYQQLFNPTVARFTAHRGKPENYFQGISQNAARKIMAELGIRHRKSELSATPSGERYSSAIKGSPKPYQLLSPAEKAEIQDMVRFILGQASPHVRRALELRYWYDWPIQIIAKHLGENRFALARKLRTFFEKMREQLGGD